MARIYTQDNVLLWDDIFTEDALEAASEEALERQEEVVLEDGGLTVLVHADGSTEPWEWPGEDDDHLAIEQHLERRAGI